MALARIISRSQLCSRELALHLLARGYAVEIVSPDAVPDNIADLELRVDSGPGDLLTANVEAHNGAHSASLEFIHHLKSPMMDFRRRPPQTSEPISSTAAPLLEPVPVAITKVAEPVLVSKVAEKVVELPTRSANDSPRVSEPVRQSPPIMQTVVMSLPPVTVPSLPIGLIEAGESRKPVITAVIPKSRSEHKVKLKPVPKNDQQTWFWRAAVSSSCVLTMAFVLSFGVQRRNILPVSDPGLPGFKVLATDRQAETGEAKSAPAKTVRTAQPRALDESAPKPAAATSAPPIGKAEKKAASASKNSARPKVEVAASKRNRQPSRSRAPDQVAPNTIVYYHLPSAQVTQARKAPNDRVVSSKQGDGVIAASTVPSAKPAPKAVPPK